MKTSENKVLLMLLKMSDLYFIFMLLFSLVLWVVYSLRVQIKAP